MKIEIEKKTPFQCEYTLSRKDHSKEILSLDTKTFLLHDICHFAVEKHLKYQNGFWGMLSKGHTFDQLFGKDNPQTEELRFIEKIVGPIQSIYSGHIPKQNFAEFINHLDFDIPQNVLNHSLVEIEEIMNSWKSMPVGQKLILNWEF